MAPLHKQVDCLSGVKTRDRILIIAWTKLYTFRQLGCEFPAQWVQVAAVVASLTDKITSGARDELVKTGDRSRVVLLIGSKVSW